MIINEKIQFVPSLNEDIKTVVLQNRKHTQVTICNYGAVISSIKTPDRRGNFGEIVLGFDNAEEYATPQYRANCPYFGAVVGRYANRINKGEFTLKGKHYQLDCNNGSNHLHGGTSGFHQQIWKMETFKEAKRTGVVLTLTSPHMEGGYPGTVDVKLTYTLTFDNELVIDYEAKTDQPTILNLTNHTYFNLSSMQNNVLDHLMVLYADKFTPKDEAGIPSGEILTVNNSPLDFSVPHKIGERINDVDGIGYDHNFVFKGVENDLNIGARLVDKSTGRSLEFYSTEPGFQLYTGNYLDGTFQRNGIAFGKHYGICLEAQKFPDSPNQDHFPSAVLNPGETYHQTTVYKFGTTE